MCIVRSLILSDMKTKLPLRYFLFFVSLVAIVTWAKVLTVVVSDGAVHSVFP